MKGIVSFTTPAERGAGTWALPVWCERVRWEERRTIGPKCESQKKRPRRKLVAVLATETHTSVMVALQASFGEFRLQPVGYGLPMRTLGAAIPPGSDGSL